jgi:hypothetical protein
MELVNPAIWYQSWRFVSVLNGATAVSPARL